MQKKRNKIGSATTSSQLDDAVVGNCSEQNLTSVHIDGTYHIETDSQPSASGQPSRQVNPRARVDPQERLPSPKVPPALRLPPPPDKPLPQGAPPDVSSPSPDAGTQCSDTQRQHSHGDRVCQDDPPLQVDVISTLSPTSTSQEQGLKECSTHGHSMPRDQLTNIERSSQLDISNDPSCNDVGGRLESPSEGSNSLGQSSNTTRSNIQHESSNKPSLQASFGGAGIKGHGKYGRASPPAKGHGKQWHTLPGKKRYGERGPSMPSDQLTNMETLTQLETSNNLGGNIEHESSNEPSSQASSIKGCGKKGCAFPSAKGDGKQWQTFLGKKGKGKHGPSMPSDQLTNMESLNQLDISHTTKGYGKKGFGFLSTKGHQWHTPLGKKGKGKQLINTGHANPQTELEGCKGISEYAESQLARLAQDCEMAFPFASQAPPATSSPELPANSESCSGIEGSKHRGHDEEWVYEPPQSKHDKFLEMRERARQEGIVEATLKGGAFFVKRSKYHQAAHPCTAEYWCRLCGEAVAKDELGAHLDNARHQFRASVSGDVSELLPWEKVVNGFPRCVLCQKRSDPSHEDAPYHKRNVDQWYQVRYPTPKENWLAYADHPESGRTLKCLLCKKFVDDFSGIDTSKYIGAHSRQSLKNSSEHNLNLAKYFTSNHCEKLQEAILVEKRKWHPSEPSTHSETPLRRDESKMDNSVAANMALGRRDESKIISSAATNKVSIPWMPPPEIPPPSGSCSLSHDAAATLPNGWYKARCKEFDRDYYFRERGPTQWAFPPR